MSQLSGDAGRSVTLTEIRFEAKASGGSVLATFVDPGQSCATAWPLALEAMDRPSGEGASGRLLVLCVPVGCADESQWRARGQAWMACAGGGAPVNTGADGWSVTWRPGRAVVQGPGGRMDAALAALAEFAHYEGELRLLESEIAAGWGELESHSGMAHDVSTRDLRRRGELGAATAKVMNRRVRCSRIERRLLSPAGSLAGDCAKLGRLLRREADVEDRLETLDGQIETCEYVYELANQRMAEYRNFRREFLVEILIVVVLGAELVLLLVDFYFKNWVE